MIDEGGNFMDRKKILLVDDEEINLELFDVMLSKLGFDMEMAADGEEALEKLKEFYPDLIILDNIMPKMSGWELTRLLKGDPQYRNIPLIMFSALDDVKNKVEGFELGVDDYITKPFNFSEVLARIRAVLRNRELFEQVLVREFRLRKMEEIGTQVDALVRALLSRMDELDRVIDGGPLEKIRELRTVMNSLDNLVAVSLADLEDRKREEISISTLEDRLHSPRGEA
jgi:DNA-binding response OmpR family regulator